MTAAADTCIACGHDRRLHGPIGATEQQPGAKCVTCQCTGLDLSEHNSADDRAEGGAT